MTTCSTRGVRGIFFSGGKVIFLVFFPSVKCFFPVKKLSYHFGRLKTKFTGFWKVKSKKKKKKKKSSPHSCNIYPPSFFTSSFHFFLASLFPAGPRLLRQCVQPNSAESIRACKSNVPVCMDEVYEVALKSLPSWNHTDCRSTYFNYRLITAYLLLRVNLDKIMHARWDFDASCAQTRRVSALDKHQNWSASAYFV